MALPSPSADSAALITGASSGIGAAIAGELASRGHGVILVARREDRLAGLARELADRHGVRAEPLATDLLEADQRRGLGDRTAELGLAVEVLVNNAGFGSSSTLVKDDPEWLTSMVRLNCEALVDLQARYAAPMAERGRGAIINVASTAAFQPMPGTATYAATKAFVLSLSEATHAELAPKGITVTAVCPGPVETEFVAVSGVDESVAGTVPGIVWTAAEDVASAAVNGADRGKRVVIPGLINRAGALAGQHSPRSVLLPLAQRLWRRAL